MVTLTSGFPGISELFRYFAPLRIRYLQIAARPHTCYSTAKARYLVRDGDTCLYIDRCDEKRIVPKLDQSYVMGNHQCVHVMQ